MAKKSRGRPKKEEDTIEVWQFGCAAIVMSAYDEARAKREKRCGGVKLRNPKEDSKELGGLSSPLNGEPSAQPSERVCYL